MYMYKEPDKIYNCAIITDSSLSRIDKENDIMLYTNNSINEYIGEGDLVLYLDPYYKEKINFYDEHGKYLIKNKYPYIKEFIDNVIISKINKDIKILVIKLIDKYFRYLYLSLFKNIKLVINNKSIIISITLVSIEFIILKTVICIV